MMKMSFIVVPLFSFLGFAGLVKAQAKGDYVKEVVEFFSNSNLQAASGCDSTTWDAVYSATLVTAQGQALAAASAEQDNIRVQNILRCYDIATDKAAQVEAQLYRGIAEEQKQALDAVSTDPVDRPQTTLFLALDTADKMEAIRHLLKKYDDLISIRSYVMGAAMLYLRHQDETQYNELLSKYKQRSDRPIVVSPPVKPPAFHCTSNTNSVTGETQTDCQ